MQLVSLQEPVGNPRMEVNVMEIYYDLFNVGRGVPTGSRSTTSLSSKYYCIVSLCNLT